MRAKKLFLTLLLCLFPLIAFADFEIYDVNGTKIFGANVTGNLTANITGTQGPPGVNGTNGTTPILGVDYFNGTNGINGTNGTDGVSISNAQVNATGWLNITLSNSTVLGPWNVTGPQGVQGNPGTNGTNGTNSTFTILTLPNVIISNATTLVNLTGMQFSFDANSNYTYDMYMICQSNATTTGYRFAIDTSVAVTGVYLNFYHQLANTGTLSGGSSLADNTSAGTTSGVATANATIPILGGGLLVSGANGGTAQFMFGSEVAGNSTVYTSCRAGSKIRVMKLD